MNVSKRHTEATRNREMVIRAQFKDLEDTYSLGLPDEELQEDVSLDKIFDDLSSERQYRIQFALWAKGMRNSMPNVRGNDVFLAASSFRQYHSLFVEIERTNPERAEELAIMEEFIGYEIDAVRNPGMIETEPVSSVPGSRSGNNFLMTAIEYSS